VHRTIKAVGRNEMPFGRGTRMGDLGSEPPGSQRRRQITLAIVSAEQLSVGGAD